MADHCRKQIRDAIQAYLAANVTTALSVISGRVHPLDVDLPKPAILIFTAEESAEDITKRAGATRNRTLARTLTLTVEGHAAGDDVIDTLDAIATEIEPQVVEAVPAWVKEITLTDTTIEMTGEAVEPVGMVRLQFEVVYHADMATPDTPK